MEQFIQVDICQSEKDGDLQSKLQAIKTADEEDFGHSQIGQVNGFYINTLLQHSFCLQFVKDKNMAMEDHGVPAHEQHGADPGLVEPLHGSGVHCHLHCLHGGGPPRLEGTSYW